MLFELSQAVFLTNLVKYLISLKPTTEVVGFFLFFLLTFVNPPEKILKILHKRVDKHAQMCNNNTCQMKQYFNNIFIIEMEAK